MTIGIARRGAPRGRSLAAGACAAVAALALAAPALGRDSGMRLTSPAFHSGQTIPARFTCSGADHSPPLDFAGVPRGAKALALTLIDTTAHGFTHWTVWNISPSVRRIAAGGAPHGARQGENSFQTMGYGGPCPPIGQKPHRYVFTLYALNRQLSLSNGAPPATAESEIRAASFERATLVGFFGRQRRRRQPVFTG